MDADDISASGKLKKQFEQLERTIADISNGNWQKLKKNVDGKHYKSQVVRRELTNPEIDLFGTFWCPPAVYLFKRAIVEKVGGWNENLPIIQDARFVLDCALNGAKFVYCDVIVAYYRVHNMDSISKKDLVAFVRDCFVNACEVEGWWIKNGGIAKERKKALEDCLEYITRAIYYNDKETFNKACDKL